MKKKRTWIILLIVVLLLIIDIGGANYLASFAIGRTTSGGVAVVPEPSTTTETQDIVNTNIRKIYDETIAWMETMKPEAVSIISGDGLKLVGEICQADTTSHKWVIGIHGYTASHNMMWDYGHFFYEEGFNLLFPDMRGHGESEGNYIGMGWLDRKDVVKWIDLICERDPDAEIVLFGVSMGGATVMMTSGEELPVNVKAVVEDCGYTSVWDIFSDEMKVLFHLPDFPLLYTASGIAKIRAGYFFKEASTMKQVEKTKVPILFIHGAEDNFVHTEMVYRLYDICPTEKDIMVVENAGHGQSYYYEPKEYTEKIFDFLKKYVD